MKKIVKNCLSILVASAAAFIVTGCTSLQETMASQMEVPTLEKQANRVALGMTIVRQNNIMAYKMPISADSKWPNLIATELTPEQSESIKQAIMGDPYFSTFKYTDSIQRKALGSGALVSMLGDSGNIVASALDSAISPMAYRAIQKIEILYGKDPKNWPNIFDFDDSLDNFLDFKDAELIEIEASTSDAHQTLDEAMISLTPVSLQKDLNAARLEMLDSFKNTAELNREKGNLETTLKADEIKTKNKIADYTPMSSQEKLDTKKEIDVLATRIKEAESLADEKELIYFKLIDDAVVALESEINLDDENYIKLAKNLHTAADQIQVGAVEAGTSFGLALTNILANNIVLKFPTELESLKQASSQIPADLRDNYNERMKRLLSNAIYLLPNMAIGTYYATKQASVAGKYKDVTEVILEAHEVKVEQEAEAKEQQEKEAAKLSAK